jgi:hypothetical protein
MTWTGLLPKKKWNTPSKCCRQRRHQPRGFTGIFYKKCWQTIKGDQAELITKTLAIRLAQHMDHLISSSQSAFIKGRCIHDNFMHLRNLARTYHRAKTPALLLKLDTSKAFDMVSWEYLLEKLEHRGFSTRWRDFGKAEKKLSGWQGRLLNLAPHHNR